MDVETKLVRARVQLLLEKCFYGNIAMNLEFREMPDYMTTRTMATDGEFIYYDKDFVDSLSERELMFLISHEILHCILLHLIRGVARLPKLDIVWNFAIDYATNAILRKDFGDYVPDHGLYNSRFEGMSAEEIYVYLLSKGTHGRQNGVDVEGLQGNQRLLDEHLFADRERSALDELKQKWEIATAKAYEQLRNQGSSCLGADIVIKSLLSPVIDWRSYMRQFIIDSIDDDYKWLPPNKRFVYNGLYLPSIRGESLGTVVVIIDNSGSTVDVQDRFFSECNALLQTYNIDLHLIVCDMQINGYYVYQQGDQMSLNYKGGGGTDMRIAFDYIKKKSLVPNVVVCLTDGMTTFPAREEFPTLWVITKDGIKLSDIPFGMKVKIDK